MCRRSRGRSCKRPNITSRERGPSSLDNAHSTVRIGDRTSGVLQGSQEQGFCALGHVGFQYLHLSGCPRVQHDRVYQEDFALAGQEQIEGDYRALRCSGGPYSSCVVQYLLLFIPYSLKPGMSRYAQSACTLEVSRSLDLCHAVYAIPPVREVGLCSAQNGHNA